MRLLTTVLTALALAVVALVPAGAQVATHTPCTNISGKTVVTPDTPFSEVIETPIGAANSGAIAAGTGSYVIDLAGLPVGTRRDVSLTLDMSTAGVTLPLVTDYDLIVNGENDLSTDQPEVKSVPQAKHCQTVNLEVDVFTGTPADELTLTVEIPTPFF